MSEQNNTNLFLSWTKQRIHKMDATLASLQAKASQIQAGSKVKAEQLLADLTKRRDEFHAKIKAQNQADEAAWRADKEKLESQWQAFEAQVKTYVETVGEQLEQQETMFQDVDAAQARARREAGKRQPPFRF